MPSWPRKTAVFLTIAVSTGGASGWPVASALAASKEALVMALITGFMGGATMPDSAKSNLDEAVKLACGELKDLLDIRSEPVFSKLAYWPQAIPQYNVGHGEFLTALEETERAWPGLLFCANYRGGPGLSDCLDSAIRTSDLVLGSTTSA